MMLDWSPPASATEEQLLLWALLHRTVLDLRLSGPDGLEAWSWVFQERGDQPWSFAWVCELLDLDAADLRVALLRRGYTKPASLVLTTRKLDGTSNGRPIRQPGIGRGCWTNAGTARCARCGIAFLAARLELTRYCAPCRPDRSHHRRGSRAA